MNWLAFIAEMTKAVIWPFSIVFLCFLFRKPLLMLPERLLSLRLGAWQAEFSAKGTKIAEEIGRSNSSALTNSTGDEKLLALAEQSPRAAVIEAAIQIEVELRKLASKRASDVKNRPPGQLIRLLEKDALIDRKTAESLQGLFVMRNLAVHGSESELTTQRANEFIVLANAIRFVLHTKE